MAYSWPTLAPELFDGAPPLSLLGTNLNLSDSADAAVWVPALPLYPSSCSAEASV